MMKTGDIVLFGAYKQNMFEEMTAIQWIVLDITGEKALLVSRFALEAKHYNSAAGETTWEKCSLRAWLNHSFYETAFSETDKKAVLLTKLDNKDPENVYMYIAHEEENATFPVRVPASLVSAPTEDYVFLLSKEDVLKYEKLLTGKLIHTKYLLSTEYALEKGVHSRNLYVQYDKSGFLNEDYVAFCDYWWLRNRIGDGNRTACVIGDNIEEFFTFFHDEMRLGVRPAIWVTAESLTKIEPVNVEPKSLMENMGISLLDFRKYLKLLDKKELSAHGNKYIIQYAELDGDIRIYLNQRYYITANTIELFAESFPCADPETVQELRSIYFFYFCLKYSASKAMDAFSEFHPELLFQLYSIIQLLQKTVKNLE